MKEKIFRHMKTSLMEGKLVPFVGAGASIGAHLISDSDEPTLLSGRLPSGRELAYQFAKYWGFTNDEVDVYDLLDVMSAFAAYVGVFELEEKLKAIFAAPAEPTMFHRWLAKQDTFHLILTTNYDTLIERAFRNTGREFHVIMTPHRDIGSTDLLLWWPPSASKPIEKPIKEFDIFTLDAPVIYKLHGGVDPNLGWQHSVINEYDYFEIGGRIYEGSLLPPSLANFLAKRSFLFIGYSFRDVHVRYLLYQIIRWPGLQQQQHYIVNPKIGRLDAARIHNFKFETLEITADELGSTLDEID